MTTPESFTKKCIGGQLALRICVLFLMTSGFVLGEDSSFRRDVMPVLFRAGCNAGTCHGSSRGKDGFMLSLFGYDPSGDYFRLTEEMLGRRVNVADPSESLMLLKATGMVPHTGGKRFSQDSLYYKTLLQWIEAGAQDDAQDVPVPIAISIEPERLQFDVGGNPESTKVIASYSDGSKRNVTNLALFQSNNPDTAVVDAEGSVMPGKRGDTYVFARFNRFMVGSEVIVLPPRADESRTTDAIQVEASQVTPPVYNYIDELVYDRLRKLRIRPSELCDDEAYLRRVYLDLAGIPPTIQQYHEFMNDANSNKREALVDKLIESDEFSQVWTAKWAEWVRLMGGGYAPTGTDVKAAETYYQWIGEQMRAGRPMNEFVAEQVAATGSNLTVGPVNLYTMLVHDVRFDPKVFASNLSQLTLGIQIQCAECHNHPFDRWTMEDYYGFVSFFTGIKRKLGAEPREMYIFNDPDAAPAKHLVDNRPVRASVLGGEIPVAGVPDQRQALAAWLADADNPHFAKNISNRVWSHFFSRGLVEPVDDMRTSNPPTNKPLLDALTQHFVASDFNLRSLVRDICTSRVYQLSGKPNETNNEDSRQFSRSRLRRLRADVLLDTIITSTDGSRNFEMFPAGTKAIEHYPRTRGDTVLPNAGDSFFETFGRSRRGSICVCETRSDSTLSQTLHLLAGDTISDQVRGGRVVPRLLESGNSPEEIIETLFIRALSRKPNASELAEMRELVGEHGQDVGVYEDIFCSLLQATEFGFNH